MYFATDYLLDRANIHDTITKLYMLTDLKLWDRLATEVPAETITLEYSTVFGSPHSQHSPDGLVQQWRPLMEKMSARQHVVTGLLIDLPQPGERERPTKAKVVANVYVNLSREGIEGGSHTSNGGKCEVELVRNNGVGNPWRIEVFRALDGFWSTGNMKVLTE